jgi:hypothetical protein
MGMKPDLSLKEERRQIVFANRVPRRIFGCKRGSNRTKEKIA